MPLSVTDPYLFSKQGSSYFTPSKAQSQWMTCSKEMVISLLIAHIYIYIHTTPTHKTDAFNAISVDSCLMSNEVGLKLKPYCCKKRIEPHSLACDYNCYLLNLPVATS